MAAATHRLGDRRQDGTDVRVDVRWRASIAAAAAGRHRDGVAQDRRTELQRRPRLDPPGNWLNFDNYVTAFPGGRMLTAFINTTFILVVSVAGTVIIGSMTAYAIDRFNFRGREARDRPVPARHARAGRHHPGRDVPDRQRPRAVQHPLVGDRAVHRHRHRVDLHLPAVHARRSRARWTRRRRSTAPTTSGSTGSIILPLLKPAIATVVIIKGIAIYNEFYIPFLYMPSPDLGVVSTSLFRFKGPFGAQWEVISAGVDHHDHPDPDPVPRPAAVHLQRLHARGGQVTDRRGGSPRYGCNRPMGVRRGGAHSCLRPTSACSTSWRRTGSTSSGCRWTIAPGRWARPIGRRRRRRAREPGRLPRRLSRARHPSVAQPAPGARLLHHGPGPRGARPVARRGRPGRRSCAIWTGFAEHFLGVPADALSFDLLNEPPGARPARVHARAPRRPHAPDGRTRSGRSTRTGRSSSTASTAGTSRCPSWLTWA